MPAATNFSTWSVSELVNKLMMFPTREVAEELISRIGVDRAKGLVSTERNVRDMERRGEEIGSHVQIIISRLSQPRPAL